VYVLAVKSAQSSLCVQAGTRRDEFVMALVNAHPPPQHIPEIAVGIPENVLFPPPFENFFYSVSPATFCMKSMTSVDHGARGFIPIKFPLFFSNGVPTKG
jgi:hypothetical protein